MDQFQNGDVQTVIEEKEVTISLAEYQELLDDSKSLQIIMDILYKGASLNWKDDGLMFNNDHVGVILKILDEGRYHKVLDQLKSEKTAAGSDSE